MGNPWRRVFYPILPCFLNKSVLSTQYNFWVPNTHLKWCRPMHEITFSTDDKPKLLSQVVDSSLDQNVVYINIRTISFLNKSHKFGVHNFWHIIIETCDQWSRKYSTRLEKAFKTNLPTITLLK